MNSTSQTARLKLLWRGLTQRAVVVSFLSMGAKVGHLDTFTQAIDPLTELPVSTTAIWL